MYFIYLNDVILLFLLCIYLKSFSYDFNDTENSETHNSKISALFQVTLKYFLEHNFFLTEFIYEVCYVSTEDE